MTRLAIFLLVLSGCAPTGAPVVPITIGIASFNMGWAGTPAEFARYVSVCSAPAVNYCDTRSRIERGATAATDAEKARAARCQRDTLAAAGGRDASMRVPPCNAYRAPRPALGAPRMDPAASRVPAAYQEKIDQLTITVDRTLNVEEAHRIADEVERRIADAVGAREVVVHVEPDHARP